MLDTIVKTICLFPPPIKPPQNTKTINIFSPKYRFVIFSPNDVSKTALTTVTLTTTCDLLLQQSHSWKVYTEATYTHLDSMKF